MKQCPATISAFVMLMPLVFDPRKGKYVRGRGMWQSIEVELPCHRIVCDRCSGTGSHVNPNIDGHGISSDEFDQDPEFAESYWRGDYDVRCHECKGARVLDVVDYDAMKPKMQRRFDAYLEQKAADDAEDAFERRWCV